MDARGSRLPLGARGRGALAGALAAAALGLAAMAVPGVAQAGPPPAGGPQAGIAQAGIAQADTARAGTGQVGAGRVAPKDFWRTPSQALAIADRQPAVVQLRRRDPGVRAQVYPADLGLWAVVYRSRSVKRATVLVEDRTGDVLEPGPFSWPPARGRLTWFSQDVELACLGLGILFLLAFCDLRRPLRLVNLDLLVLLSFGASLALFDRGDSLVSVPLVYPPLAYLLVRLLVTGVRGGRVPRAGRPWPLVPWADERVLMVGLGVVLALRVAFNLALGQTNDVSYASVYGANSIHHGWSLYAAGSNHVDTYGPITYLAYLPFELIFPLSSNWQHDYLPAAHAAAITFDLLTVLGLFLVGRRLRAGRAGRRLGLVLALAWVSCPFTLFPLAVSTNDGLVPLFVVYALLALSTPALRGGLLGLAAAAKFAPLALAGLFAAGRGDRRPRSLAVFGLAMATVIGGVVWLYLPAGGLEELWRRTIGFQLHRHSFLSLWGQHPQLEWLRTGLKVAAGGLAVWLFAFPRRRDTLQVAALSGAILISLQLTVVYWSFEYLVWFIPFVLVGLLAARECDRPAEVRAWGRALEPAPLEPAAAGATGAEPVPV
jgi:hypothetical protein